MKTQEAVKFFGSINKLAGVLDIWPHSVKKWGKYPPYPRQCQIEIASGGQLKAEKPAGHREGA